MDIVEALRFLEKQVADPSQGLPEEVFCYISKMTPLVNVDLLIKDERGRTLLSWRNDPYAGKGWHVPGGIVRFRESLEARAKKVAEIEIGTILDFEKVPIAVNQFICPEQPVRSHFISFLYKCFLPGAFALNKQGISTGEAGYLGGMLNLVETR